MGIIPTQKTGSANFLSGNNTIIPNYTQALYPDHGVRFYSPQMEISDSDSHTQSCR